MVNVSDCFLRLPTVINKIITENRKKIKEGMKDILIVLKAVTSIHYEVFKVLKK